MIKAVVFDLDNTLVDFMKMKKQSISAATNAMIDAGLNLTYQEIQSRINVIFEDNGIVFPNDGTILIKEIDNDSLRMVSS